MAMIPSDLATKLTALAKEDLTPEKANEKFAEIIVDFIKTATISVTVEGMGNQGVMVSSSGDGKIS